MPDGWRNSRWRAIIRGVIPFILWQLTFILSLLFKKAFITLPIILFCGIYSSVRLYWFIELSSGLFEPAWPAARTRLVLLMAAIPAWGLSMAVGVALWPLAKYLHTKAMRRKLGRSDYEMVIPMEDPHSSSTPLWREAAMEDEPAPVFTCWNGIVAFRADPVLPIPLRTAGRLSVSPLSRPLPATHPAYPQPASLTPALTPPLAFRSSGERECFSSESFNLPYDLRRRFDMQRIYVNPRVITGYEWKYYVWFKYIPRHWLVVWWIKTVEAGNGMQFAKMVVGDAKRVWTWDGGECHPWW
ncbi:hypothetical protein DFH09DRAFT_1374064 [Mycena vulgaris]|nr:hypothetical protein DFH09DRAFT_1374064 [Mycena vulgaris]